MKFNKKILIGLLTASCVVAGTLGLAACSGGKPEVTVGDDGYVYVNGEKTDVVAKGDDVKAVYVAQIDNEVHVYYSDGTSQKVPYVNTDLAVGKNNVNLATDVLAAANLTYKFTAPEGEMGKYVISVTGDKAKVTLNNTVIDGNTVVELTNEKPTVELKCTTTDGKAAAYSITVGLVEELSLEYPTNITLPQLGYTTFMNVTVPEGQAGAYAFDLAFATNNDRNANHKFTVNGKEYTIGGGQSSGFISQLAEGSNVIALTSAIMTDSTAPISVTKIANGGALSANANSLTFAKGETYYAYTFTATADGYYALSVPYESTLCVADSEGNIMLSEAQWKGTYDDDVDPTTLTSSTFKVEANKAATFFIMVEDSNVEGTFSLTLAEVQLPTVNVGDTEVEVECAPDGSSTIVVLNVTTTGTYTLTVSPTVGSSLTLGETVFDMMNKTLEIELVAGANEIVLVNDGFFPVSALISLEAKA